MPPGSKTRRTRGARATHTPEDRARLMWWPKPGLHRNVCISSRIGKMYVSVRVHFMCSYLKPAVLPRFSKCTLAICHFLVEPANQKKHKCCILCVTTAHTVIISLLRKTFIYHIFCHTGRQYPPKHFQRSDERTNQT